MTQAEGKNMIAAWKWLPDPLRISSLTKSFFIISYLGKIRVSCNMWFLVRSHQNSLQKMVQMVDVRDFLKIQNLRVCKIEKLEEIVFAILLNQKQESVLLCVSYKNNL